MGVVAGVKSQSTQGMLERASTLKGMKDLCSSFASKTALHSSPFGELPMDVPPQKPTFLRAFSTPTFPSSTPLPSLGDHLTLRPVPRHYEPFSSFSTSCPAPLILQTVVKALEAIDRCYYNYCPTRHTIRGIVYLQHTSSTFAFHLYEHTQKDLSTERFLGELKRCSGCSIGFRQFYQTVMEACSSLFQQEGTQEQSKQQAFSFEPLPVPPPLSHSQQQQAFSFEPLPAPPPLSDDEDAAEDMALDYGALSSWISSRFVDAQAEGIRVVISLLSNPSQQVELVEKVKILEWLGAPSSPLLSSDHDVQNTSVELLSSIIDNPSLQPDIVKRLTEILCTLVEQPVISLNNLDTCINAVRCLQTLTQSPIAMATMQDKQYSRCRTVLDSAVHYLQPRTSLHRPIPSTSSLAPLVLTR
jgi:hypothetical protein